MIHLIADNSIWLWLALAVVLLAVELATGSGWLLWPAASAAVTGLIVYGVHISPAGATGFFAILTIITTLAGRRFFRRPAKGPDINDAAGRLIGQAGVAASTFEGGSGRAMVDGKEWAAELEGDQSLAKGEALAVTAILGGSRLRVRAG
ncbi:MAG: NfeD family protein [Caulobacteraceae bacterium]|nr:NfeD family protein [Caulobacteraceae bacterium]